MRKISIGSWAYTIGPYADRPVPFDEVCTQLRELGFDGVELGGFPPHPNPDDVPTAAGRAEVLGRLKDRGLAFSGLAANLWSQHLVDTDDGDAYIAEFRKNCAFCNDLEIKGIRVDTVQPPTILETLDYGTAIRRVTSTWRECIQIAKDHGLYMTWEFEPGFCFNKPSDVVRVLNELDDPAFGVMYDTSHGHMCAVVGARHHGEKETLPGGQVELVDKLAGRINHIHLIDSDNTCHKDEKGEDETSMHLPFGNGVVDFDAIVPRLAKEDIGHDWWTIDLCFWPDAWDATAQCKTAIDALNAKYGG